MPIINLINKYVVTPGVQKWMYNVSGFNKYGLMRDDIRSEMDPDVQEALRRLPLHIRDERNFRLVRALQLDAQRRILPKEQWTKFEEDVLYLTPLVNEVVKEREEKEQWNLE